ncbi:MAG: 4Fe-4S binding protein, partial [Thermodesulfobacteriota bacterium]
ANHPKINLLTYAEVMEVRGEAGNFYVRIRKKPTYVDPTRCTGCGDCTEACVLKKRVPSEFNLGLSRRRAIYIPFPQAVPLKAVIDEKSCLFLS